MRFDIFIVVLFKKYTTMEVTYYLKESEFDLSIFESIKTAFKNRLMKISIETEDSTIVTQEKKHDYTVSMPYDALSKIADSFEKEESFDLMASLENFKIPNE
jgi:hypothetical protein